LTTRESGRDESGLTWILGSSRSGSTWLLRMLSEIEEVAGIDDPHLGHHLGPWRPISLAWAAAGEEAPELRTLRQVKEEKPSYFFNERYADAWRPALRNLIEARFLAEARDQCGEDLRAVVVKEPGSQEADLLLSLFPESRLIFLLRDGRDVVDSWIDAYRDGSWAIGEGAFGASEDGREALVRWQASVWAYRTAAVREAYERHDPSRRVLVRYEDLLADPAGQLERICALIGIDCDAHASALRSIVDEHRFSALPARLRGSGLRERAAQPGAWRRNLSGSEQEAMHRIMGPELERAGYEIGSLAEVA
jgi:hypothetical protein